MRRGCALDLEDASSDVMEELKIMARLLGREKLQMTDVLNTAQLDNGTYGVLVE